ncbi:MAG: ATP phosphoribosyltransferase regulatory subunit [Alphaproteobacteria bacterium]|nr:ATP phosphoribosyltransferase regulatory subunit [Alphaproteobacteria bacterium]
MSETASPTLLPEGLRDVLPSDAEAEANLVERLTASFNANGYDRVSPPLVEFESTLLAGMGAATADRIFRMVDPISQRTLGIRADVTAQIARLASTRLQNAPRPLRLMYAGQVLRVKGHQLRPERQFTQVGFELVGPESVAADAEAIIVAVQAVVSLDIKDITIDLALPPLVPSLLESVELDDNDTDALYSALNHKDAAEIRRLGGAQADILSALVEASGPLSVARDVLGKIDLPAAAAAHLETLFEVADTVKAVSPDLKLTVDLVENRGLQYHTGVTFFLFAKGSTREIGRGGRYHVDHGDDVIEPATGATLFMDALLPVAPHSSLMSCVYAPYGTTRNAIGKLQSDGFRVRVSLSTETDSLSDAKALGCSHMFQDGEVVDVSSEG